jgi:hypothetical protein
VFEMKKILIVIAVLAVVAVALGAAGYAYAQTTAPNGTCPAFAAGGCTGGAYGPGARGQGMMGRGGMMGGRGTAGTYGPMHEYMLQGFAEAFGLTTKDLQAKLDAGETMWSIAEAQGKTLEDFQALMVDIRSKSVEQAVAAGTLTQEQAQRWEQMQANGFGPGTGTCPGMGGGQRPGRGGRWNVQP